MEMISAKTAYLDSMAGYNDTLDTIKNQIIQIIQLANTEGKFRVSYYIEDCPTEIITWLNEYGYTVITEEGYIIIDWDNAYLAEASATIEYTEGVVDPDEVSEDTSDTENESNPVSTYHVGLQEIYINSEFFSTGPLLDYTVDRVIVAGSERSLLPTEQAEVYQTRYNSYLKVYLIKRVDDEEKIAVATIDFAKNATSKLGVGGSLTALYEESGTVRLAEQVEVTLVAPEEDEDPNLGTINIYYLFDVGEDGSPYGTENPYAVSNVIVNHIHQRGIDTNPYIYEYLEQQS